MKLIVETKGASQVFATGTDNHARHDRPSVVNKTHLMMTKVGSGELIVLGQVNDDATDAEFVNSLASAKGDRDLAVQSFMSEYPAEEAAAERPSRRRKAEAPAE